jgi:hypothetical protein
VCILIDTCAISCVLDTTNALHPEFAPVLSYLTKDRGKIVGGGTKFKKEIAELRRYSRVLAGMERSGQLKMLPDEKVDALQLRIEELTVGRGFNDQHIAALVVASGSPVVCTKDLESIPLLKDLRVFNEVHGKRPAVYTKAGNSDLLARALRDKC